MSHVELTTIPLTPEAPPPAPVLLRVVFAHPVLGALMAPLSLVARDIVRSFGDRTVLDGVDLVATAGQPIGLVGENGVGKSTLMRVLAGLDPPDSGSVTAPDDLAYLGQELSFPVGATVADVLAGVLAPLHAAVTRLESLAGLLSTEPGETAGADHPGDPTHPSDRRGSNPRITPGLTQIADEYAATLAWAEQHEAWDADRRAELAAAHLGLRDVERDRLVAELSGGERTRLALAAIVTRRPDVVLLDEPTNHLDDAAMEFVEEFVVSSTGVVVVASHDRVFLDRVAAVVVDLDPSWFGVDGDGGDRHVGDFTSYLAGKRASRRRWEDAYLAQREELNELRTALRTTARRVAPDRGPRDGDKMGYDFKSGTVATSVSRRVRHVERRIAVAERERIPKPPRPLRLGAHLTGPQAMDADQAPESGRVWVQHLHVRDRVRVERCVVEPGERLLVTGSNGSGKSSLLSVLAGQLPPTSGDVQVTARRIGYLPQDVVFAAPQSTAHEVYAAAVRSGDDPVPLGELGLVHPRELGKPVRELSVGQQRRLALALVVLAAPDLLLLDEPTNHISLALAGELEEALMRPGGTVVVTSHDRWLRDRWDGPTLGLAPGVSS